MLTQLTRLLLKRQILRQGAMNNKANGNEAWGRTVSLLSKISYSADTASVASRQATARNIADAAVTWLQPRSNMRNDAAVV